LSLWALQEKSVALYGAALPSQLPRFDCLLASIRFLGELMHFCVFFLGNVARGNKLGPRKPPAFATAFQDAPAGNLPKCEEKRGETGVEFFAKRQSPTKPPDIFSSFFLIVFMNSLR
jgi:hypothetical protein